MYADRGKRSGMWIGANCSADFGFICKAPQPGRSQLQVISQGACPTGWYQFLTQCYWFEFKFQRNFSAAQATCKKTSSTAQLAVDRGDGVLDFFLHVLHQFSPAVNESMYIGLRRQGRFGAFAWLNDACNKYTRWGCGEPNTAGHGRDCGVLSMGSGNSNSGMMAAETCHQERPFVCQMPVPSTSPPTLQCDDQKCETGWAYFRGTCYFISSGDTAEISSDNASNRCLKNFAELVSVADSDVNDFLVTQVRARHRKTGTEFWIGWREDESTWHDGTPTVFRNWACAWERTASSAAGARSCGYMLAGGSSLGKWGADRCDASVKKDGFICQRHIGATSKKATDHYPKFVQGVCGHGWTRMGGRCYLFKLASTDRTNHAGAVRDCAAQGGRLASLSTKAQNTMLMKYMLSQHPAHRTPIWLGLYRKTPTDSPAWVSGNKLAYANWACGEENAAENSGSGSGEGTSTKNCAQTSLDASSFFSSMWKYDSCSSSYNYICEVNHTQPCPPGFRKDHNSCYYFALSASVDHATAQSRCVGLKSNLVTIRDYSEQALLESFLSNLAAKYATTTQRYWIGLNDGDSDGIYTWKDGTRAIYQNWRCGSQPSARQGCVTFEHSPRSEGGKWDDSSCNTARNGFICKAHVGRSETFLSTEPDGCNAGWVNYDGMCYQFNMETADKSTYSEADKQCTKISAKLFSVHSDHINQFVMHYITQEKGSFDGAVWLSLSKVSK
ncbi:macrophage mannose receptor 1-like [Sycon ciliatum]|uniref:macrophage mannose receptor 1-like n=1 Tax=Sycon ciliatum TaxID=27933 RepID=UPI0031F71B32